MFLEDFSFSSDIAMNGESAIEYYLDNYCEGTASTVDKCYAEVEMDNVLYSVQYDGDSEYEHTIIFNIIE